MVQMELAPQPYRVLGLIIWNPGDCGCQTIFKGKVSFPAFPGLAQGCFWMLNSADFAVPLCHAMLYHPDPGDGEPWVWREPRINPPLLKQ